LWIKELDSNKAKLKLVLNYYKSKVNGDENKRKVLLNNDKELIKILLITKILYLLDNLSSRIEKN
jgi:hypothetical protein